MYHVATDLSLCKLSGYSYAYLQSEIGNLRPVYADGEAKQRQKIKIQYDPEDTVRLSVYAMLRRRQIYTKT